MLIFTPTIDKTDQSFLDGISNDVMLDLDMVCPCGATLVVRQFDCTMAILHDWISIASQSRHDELQHLTQELKLIHDLSKRHELLLG